MFLKHSCTTQHNLKFSHENSDKIIILYDNKKNIIDQHLLYGNGFSCLIQVDGNCILFDSGRNTQAFFSNIERLNIKLTSVTHFIISHRHWDHCAGTQSILKCLQPSCKTLIPTLIPKKRINVESENFYEIGDNLFIFTEIALWWLIPIIEQTLIIKHYKGLIIVVGCAHVGIVKIISKVKSYFNEPIYLIIGGMHLHYKSQKQISSIIDQIKGYKIHAIAPCHCSGHVATQLFRSKFNGSCLETYTGALINLESL